MGYYYQFKSKEIKLRKDTPVEVIEFLNAYMNESNFNYPKPNHPLFEFESWDSVFNKWAWYKEPYSFFDKEKLILFVWCDVKASNEPIIQFAKWIAPYVAGHKPKEYIGWYEGDSERQPTNLYIERIKK